MSSLWSGYSRQWRWEENSYMIRISSESGWDFFDLSSIFDKTLHYVISLSWSLLPYLFIMKKLLLLLASISVLFSPAVFALDSAEIQDSGATPSSVATPSVSRDLEISKMNKSFKFDETSPSNAGASIIMLLLQVSFYLFYSYCLYLLATKLGEEYAWLAFVPILSTILLFRMAKMSAWWILGLFVPLFNIYVIIKMIHNGISIRTWNSALMAVGLIFLYPIVMPIVAFTYKSETPALPVQWV